VSQAAVTCGVSSVAVDPSISCDRMALPADSGRHSDLQDAGSHVTAPEAVLTVDAETADNGASNELLPHAATTDRHDAEAKMLLKHGVGKATSAGSILTDLPGLTEAEAALVQRFDPAGPRDTIGFFIAKFVKEV